MESIFEQTGGTYHQEGDYLIPDITLGEDAERDIGIYGQKHKRFLKESHPALYANMLLSGLLRRNLEEINTTCYERLERLIPDMARREGVTETLKATDPLEWVGRMNSIRNRAEEIILHELVWVVDRISFLRPLSGEKPSELQIKARQAQQEKPPIRAQLKAAKEGQQPKASTKDKSQDLEV